MDCVCYYTHFLPKWQAHAGSAQLRSIVGQQPRNHAREKLTLKLFDCMLILVPYSTQLAHGQNTSLQTLEVSQLVASLPHSWTEEWPSFLTWHGHACDRQSRSNGWIGAAVSTAGGVRSNHTTCTYPSTQPTRVGTMRHISLVHEQRRAAAIKWRTEAPVATHNAPARDYSVLVRGAP